MPDNAIQKYLQETGWTISFQEVRPSTDGEYFSIAGLTLSAASIQSLSHFSRGIYKHQFHAIERYLAGDNLAITTSTASGKTSIFQTCALEELTARPNARIAAVYPLKALGTEQAGRWAALAAKSGLGFRVGRIDGGVPTFDRLRILRESRVLVMTPDIMHAWLLSSLGTPDVTEFLRNLALMIVDEAHTYSGVFGSNAAFLFRRVQHVTRQLGGSSRLIAASATMSEPEEHLTRLTGERFTLVGQELDTSPRAEMSLALIAPPPAKDLLTAVSELLSFAAVNTDHQSITFVDSRKQTEYLAAIAGRRLGHESELANEVERIDVERLRDLQIYPYRSGYEEEDRQRIQNQLANGSLRGVVSTSALEMGIDLPRLTLGVLNGIPRSATSYYQRIGRVGRQSPGVVLVVNDGTVMSESVFRNPDRLRTLPFAKSALYLHNNRIQYIHAMCLARPGGEDELVSGHAASAGTFQSKASFPSDFVNLCASERVGEVGTELQAMKAQAGDDPHHTYPLRDLDAQFKVEHRVGPNVNACGSLSHAQLMREAYPGAVYYYQTRPLRVVRIRKHQRVIEVRQERRYFTTPTLLPKLILPNLSSGNVYQARQFAELTAIECALQVGEAVVGFKERRGNNQFVVTYPLDRNLGLFWDSSRFSRYVFTSGVVITHPILRQEQVKASAIADVIGEAFLMSLPFDRQDISAGADKHRATRNPVVEGDRFVCVYDQTYGSLRLTSHLMKTEVIRQVLQQAREIAIRDSNLQLNRETQQAMAAMAASVEAEPSDTDFGGAVGIPTDRYVPVILPGSFGIDVNGDNDEFLVDGVTFSPRFNCLVYRGRYATSNRVSGRETLKHSAAVTTVPAANIQPLEGESKIGYYDLESGEVRADAPSPGEF